MKKKPRIFVHFLIHSLLLGMPMVLYVDAQLDRLACSEVTYLEVGKEGIVNCSLEPFFAVSWYTKKDYDDKEDALIHFNGDKYGRVDEYDVHPNGSLNFRSVSLHHAGSYVVTILRDATSDLLDMELYLGVYVTPDPPYPVVEGHMRQQHVYMDVSRNGQLSCSMRRVYPNISLLWSVVDPSQSRMILFQDDVVGKNKNEDNTFNITLTSLYKVTDQSVRRITIQCGVVDEIGEAFSSGTRVDLLFSSVYPVVNGHFNQKHVYLDVDREGHLTCIKENVHADSTLNWKIVELNMQDKITFQSRESVFNNNDGTVTINQTFYYEVQDHSLERITIECEVVTPDTDDILLATKVDLLFQNVYPVVNDHFNQKHVYLDVDREGHLTCIKENVDAGTTLVWKIVELNMWDKISFQSRESVFNNNDGMVTINQTFDYEVQDHSLDRITIECEVVTPDTDDIPLATKVDLLFQNVYPVVNGHFNQKHVYLDVDREGHLTCIKENVDAGTTLVWKIVELNMRDKISFQSRESVFNNNDGMVTINQTFDYEVQDHSLDRITIECEVVTPDTDDIPLATKVDLLFQNVYPVVNDHFNQKHVYLDVDREGHLTCIKENVDAGTTLVWKIVELNMRDKISFQSRESVFNNNDGMVTINQTFDYEVQDHSLDRITIECEVVTPDTDDIPLATKVDLLFQNVYPVVNDHFNQKHVYLDVDREGHLTCIKENVDAGTTLVWKVVDPTLQYSKLSFQSNAFISYNKADKININQTFDYIVHDIALERVAIECRVIEPDTDEHPYVTKVELLLGNVAIIDGCYSKPDHCALEVKRTAELTCTVKNSRYPVNLNWTVLDGGPSFDLGESVVSSQNNNDLFETSITTPYTIIDERIVSVQCVAKNANNGHLLSIAKASLGVYSDSSNKSIHGTVVAISLSTMFLVIVLGLIVIILWWCNRKLYVKLKRLTKCLIPKCGVAMVGYSIPEDTGSNKQHSDAGLPVCVTCDSEGAFNTLEDTDQDKSLDFPDSGNSGSTSGEKSGSEASVQCCVMVDTESSQSSGKQAQMLCTEENPEEVPMLHL